MGATDMGPRVLKAERKQLCWDMVDLDSQLAPEHLARVVWAFVEGLDLQPLYDRIKARGTVAGRPTPDPRVLLALWLYAAIEGVGSARALAKLCDQHAAYRWLRAGVPVNYHGLSDFRTLDAALLDRILTDSVTGLAAEGLVSLDEVAVDGTKLKASAGRGSLRDLDGLARYELAARARIERLKDEIATDPAAGERRRQGARVRAEAEVAARADGALRKLVELEAEKAERAKRHKKAEAAKGAPRASTTDPDARLMKMADGAVRPAYNLILAVAPQAQIIVGLEPTDRRNDAGLAAPMIDQIEARYGRRPARLLADTRMVTQDEIVVLAEHATGASVVYTPPPASRPDAGAASVGRRLARRAGEPAALQAWRARMACEAGRLVYGRRRLIEAVNGQIKRTGLDRLGLRGLAKVRCQALMHAIAHNIRRGHSLRLAAAAAA